MPLFSRSDGTLVKNEALVRRIMPYLMRGRNESAVYHEARFDLSKTHAWLARYNATHERRATLFHLLLWAIARTLHERPGLNRFVSGGHIYARRGVHLSFAAKQAFADDAPIRTVKVEFPAEDSFETCVERLTGSVGDARSGKKTSVDTELKLAFALPGFLIGVILTVMRWADRHNLLPAGMIRSDPMYASAFLANLGSLGISDTYHHLYEYGTVSLFGAVGRAEKMLFIGDDGQPVVKDGLKVCWSFDERIHDGFYCASSLKIAQQIVEDPDAHVTLAGAPAPR